ncbi:DUF6312 domain-containing protein [Azospirillum argentinense]|uniref:Uncharacterized protein n=1 Tax=Azospirillum argentinense TaxID=2970906 RepID=A0ABW8VGU1_9PROT|nr:hypothetical protein [Azospirillum argentinense]MBK3802696.1 hypothetical protein [Azospirillum argentinense]
MPKIKLDEAVKRISVLSIASDGKLSTRDICSLDDDDKDDEDDDGKSFVEKSERFVRRLVEAQHTMLEAYLNVHNRSNRDQNNGWLLDVGSNVVHAFGKGRKRFSESRTDGSYRQRRSYD